MGATEEDEHATTWEVERSRTDSSPGKEKAGELQES